MVLGEQGGCCKVTVARLLKAQPLEFTLCHFLRIVLVKESYRQLDAEDGGSLYPSCLGEKGVY